MLNESIRYQNGVLFCDDVPISEIVEAVGTPVYIYSLRRALSNLHRIREAFSSVEAHIHYSAKANANLSILRALIQSGAGIDAVSGGEIYKALKAGADPAEIVFAGVGKTPEEIAYAVEEGIGWFNVENAAELDLIHAAAERLNRTGIKVAFRFNPQVTANTHPYIATGHGGAKFGLTAEVIQSVLARQSDFPRLNFAGIHVHIGSQLHDSKATQQAVQNALDLIQPYPQIRTVNIGGGLPVAYRPGENLPDIAEFSRPLCQLLQGYTVLLEPGRSIIADAGILVARVLYVKKQAGQTFYILDGSMAELIRPALYQAHHEIIPLTMPKDAPMLPVQIVGPVCETADVLGRDVLLPELSPGDQVAILTAGAYGMVMSSTYNARLRSAEVVVGEDGANWRLARKRDTWETLIEREIDASAD